MNEEIKVLRDKQYLAFARLMLIIAALLLASTVVPSIFEESRFKSVCICKVNYLAYAWIAFAATALFSVMAMITAVLRIGGSAGTDKRVGPNLLLILQGVSLITGIILLLVFITRYLGVI